MAKARSGHRERLLDAAIVCLEEKGYARTTARDLVAASGTNLASIGYHFGSKEQLLNVALTEAFRRWLEPLVALAAEPDPATPVTPLGRLERSLAGVIDSLDENHGLVAACLEAWAQVERSESLRAELSATYEDFRQVIADITRDVFAEIGVTEGIDADALAILFIAVFDGLLVRSQLDGRETPSAARLLRAAAGALAALSARGADAPPADRERPADGAAAACAAGGRPTDAGGGGPRQHRG